MKNSPTGSRTKRSKGKKVGPFFRTVWTSLKSLTCSCHDPNSVVCVQPQPDLEDPELMHVSIPVRNKPMPDAYPELVCLPGQVCENLESPSVSGFSKIEQTLNIDPAIPELDDMSDLANSKLKRSLASSKIESSSSGGLQYGSKISCFRVKERIGSGAFSQVYKGTHISNEGIEVAIKNILKNGDERYLAIPDYPKPLLAEVAVMLLLGQAPSCPNVIKLHNWIEDKNSFNLIMEKPVPCQPLFDYIINTHITEAEARWMIRQLVQAVKHCVDRGVFHGDIHLGNILVVTDGSLALKLIDFGCSRLISSEGFNRSEYQGPELYTPPEVSMDTVFYAKPAYVWAVGAVLFEILHCHVPYHTVNNIHDYFYTRKDLSQECQDLIKWCLICDPAKRLTLEQLENHSWFERSSQIPCISLREEAMQHMT